MVRRSGPGHAERVKAGMSAPWLAIRHDWRHARKLYAVTQDSGRSRTYGVLAMIAYLLAKRDAASQRQSSYSVSGKP